MEDDEKVTKIVTNALCKCVIYIGLIVLAGMWLSNCNLDAETIQQCEESCTGTGSQMESVTSGKCVCESTATISDPWVLRGER